MLPITITPLDNTWIRIDAEDGVLREISDYFTFENPSAKFMRRQAQYKRWDGRIRLFKLRTRTLYRGLVSRVIQFASERNYAVENLVPEPIATWDDDGLDRWLAQRTLPFPPRNYQRSALLELLFRERGVVLSPTGSGKSFIIYLLTQILQTRTLIVVPTTGLVTQMTSDFQSYGYTGSIHQIQAGRAKQSNATITVSTWQSIYELPSSYFDQYDCVIVDEVHLAKAKSLTGLMEKCESSAFRFGFTGTLDDTQAHRLILEGLFGDIVRVASTNQLVKQQQLAPLKVKMVVLEYPELTKKQMKHAQYQDEIDYIVQDPARNEFLAQLVSQLKGNVLVLFTFIEKHGVDLFRRIEQACPHKTCHYIAGSIDADGREAIRQAVEHDDGEHVIVGSYGTMQLGVNITKLHSIVFASPSKSRYRVLQSIGRVLRLHDTKAQATLIDVVDDLRHGKRVNFVFRHAEARVQYYTSEKFPLTMHKVSLAKFAETLNTMRKRDETCPSPLTLPDSGSAD